MNSGKKSDSLLIKSNSATVMSDAKRSSDAISVKKSLSNVTYLADEMIKNGDKKQEEETTPTVGNNSTIQLPGIFVSHFDASDVDECDGGSLYYEDEPRKRCESYSAGGTRCTLMVHRDGGGSIRGSSGGLFASQRSLPWSSKCSSRLGVGDSGWDGDISRNGSLSTVSRRDWAGGPCNDAIGCSVRTSASMNLFMPFNLHRCQSTENKLSTLVTPTLDGQHDQAAQQVDGCTTRYLSETSRLNGADSPPTVKPVREVFNDAITTRYLTVKPEMSGRSSDDNSEVQRQLFSVSHSQAPDVRLSISSSRSLTGIESAVLKVTVDDEDSDSPAGYPRRSATTPMKRRRPLRQRHAVSDRGAELTTIWINHQRRQHTDDSEVERRVERLLYEIDYSVTDSVDESKIQSQEFEMSD